METNERRARASAEAADWWVRLQAADIQRTEREEFIDWLRESTLHVAEMLRMAQVHGALEHFQRWTTQCTEGSQDATTIMPFPAGVVAPRATVAPRRPPNDPRAGWIAGVAASVALVVALSLLPAIHGRVIQTDRGERREVALTDGSTIQVDPDTRLRIKFDVQSRRLYLERGRAFFHVAKNPNRPFFVEANATTVRAVGTAFSVERARQGVVVTVAEGKVAVFPTAEPDAVANMANGAGPTTLAPNAGRNTKVSAASAATASSASSAKQMFLTANEQITVPASGSADDIRKVDSNRELAWAEGKLIFENTSVAQVVEQFNRYSRVPMRVSDEALARRTVNGVFDTFDPESFLIFLQTDPTVHIHRSDRDITLGSN